MHALLRELCERHRPAVLLVTHDVDEAIVLADRVLVLEDGRIGLDLTIDLPDRAALVATRASLRVPRRACSPPSASTPTPHPTSRPQEIP